MNEINNFVWSVLAEMGWTCLRRLEIKYAVLLQEVVHYCVGEFEIMFLSLSATLINKKICLIAEI